MAGRTLPFAVCRTYGPLEAPPQRNFIITSGEKVRLLITVYERDGDTTPLNTSGMAAYFSFGDGRGYSRDGTFLSFESGQFYFDMMGFTTRDGRGQIPWRVTLGDSSEASVVAFGVINVMAAYGHRFSSTNDIIGCALTTSDGYYLDTGSGIIVVPCPGDGGGGEDPGDGGGEDPGDGDGEVIVGPNTVLWDDGTVLLWEDGQTVEYA